jgi:hypothetical protein
MRLNLRVAALATIIYLALPTGFAHAAPAPKSGHGTLVIVFKDGHRPAVLNGRMNPVSYFPQRRTVLC